MGSNRASFNQPVRSLRSWFLAVVLIVGGGANTQASNPSNTANPALTIEPEIETGLSGSAGVSSKAALILIHDLSGRGSFDPSGDLIEICTPLGVCEKLRRFSVSRDLDAEEGILAAIIASGSTVYPGNRLSIRLAVGNLYDYRKQPRAREAFAKQLLEFGRPIWMLRQYSAEIEEALRSSPSQIETSLLSRLNISDATRNRLLSGEEGVSDETRALLGDQRAQERVIEGFRACVLDCSYDTFGAINRSGRFDELSRTLVILDTPDSRAALESALGSARTIGSIEQGSVAYYVLDAISREFPEDSVVGRIGQLVFLNEAQFASSKTEQYLDELQGHLYDTYELGVSLRMPFFYNGTKKFEYCGPPPSD